jgi:hypothetical protein
MDKAYRKIMSLSSVFLLVINKDATVHTQSVL